ncbi:MAG: hypothetical protein HYV26_24590 [Candidatus Hydrogenedentes bacterium]|nr:hypothetical protein [Candidatus Hydrogenedentota bacterium]
MLNNTRCFQITAALLFLLAARVFAVESCPVTIIAPEGKSFASFTNTLHPDNRIGYRFHEHTPLIAGEAPATPAAAGIDPAATGPLEQDFAQRPGVQTHRVTLSDAEWLPQQWTFYLAPAVDGIDLLWVVATKDSGLPEYYAVQQCFRMSGMTNEAWRQEIAKTPAFSEFDLWNLTEKDAPQTSLAYVLRKGTWEALPATRDTVGARTPLGLAMDQLRTNNHLDSMPKVGPYDALMLDPIDIGLVTRVNREKTWVCGLYWQNTTHVTDHHPADCLHAIVNLGPLPPNTTRALRGKIYWFQGVLDDLKQHWQHDFQ